MFRKIGALALAIFVASGAWHSHAGGRELATPLPVVADLGSARGDLAATPAAASQGADVDPLDEDAAMLARTLGIPYELEREYLERQPFVSELVASLRKDEPSGFGGVWVRYKPEYAIVLIASPGSADDVLAAAADRAPNLAAFMTVDETALTEKALVDSMKAIEAVTQDLATSFDATVQDGMVSVTAANQNDAGLISDSLETLELPIPKSRVDISIGATKDLVNSFGGLNMDSTNSPAICTSGFSVSPIGSGADGVSDAAHCHNDEELQGVDLSSSFVEGMWGGSHDVQWYHTPGLSDVNKVKDNSGTRKIESRTGRQQMYEGFHLCHYGRSSQYGCGNVKSVNFDPGCIDGHCFDPTFIRVGSDDASGGDSGAPYYIGDSACGIVKGEASNGDPFFMAQNYMSALGIRVRVNP